MSTMARELPRKWRIRLYCVPLFLVPAGLMSVHLAFQVSYYLQNPRMLEQEMKISLVEFPDVRFCKPQRMNRHLVREANVTLPVGQFRQTTLNVTLLQYLHRISYFFTEALGEKRKYGSQVAEAFRKYAFDVNVYTSPKDEVLFCRFMGRPCSHEDFVVEKHPRYYQCYRFVPPSPGRMIEGNPRLDRGGDGLELYLANWLTVEFSDPTAFHDATTGMLMSLDPSGQRPLMNRRSILLMNMTSNIVKVSYKSYEMLDDPQESPCIAPTARKHVSYMVDWRTDEEVQYLATQEDCLIELSQRELSDTCGCVNVNMYVPYELRRVPLCQEVPIFFLHYDQLEHDSNGTLFMMYGDQRVPYREAAERQHLVSKYQCFLNFTSSVRRETCLPLCKVEEYPYVKETFPFSRFQRRAFLEAHYFSQRQPRINFSGVIDFTEVVDKMSQLGSMADFYVNIVLDEHVKPIILKEVWGYTLRSLLSDIGGISGLWVGFSVAHIVLGLQSGLRCALWWRNVISKRFSVNSSGASSQPIVVGDIQNEEFYLDPSLQNYL